MRLARLATSLTPQGGFYRLCSDTEAEHLPRGFEQAQAAGQGTIVQYSERDLLAPATPQKVLCVGRNYAAHAKELGNEVPKEPLLFLKPSSAIIGHGASIVLPPQSTRVEHEAELAVVIGKALKNANEAEVRAGILGYTCAGDITARDLQKSDGQFSRAKGFDTFCPLGPWIETELDPSDLEVSCSVCGTPRQLGRTSAMVWPVFQLISIMSQAMTLHPGDVILTGTPHGVGPLSHGDELEITIAGIGTLRLAVTSSPSPVKH
jgi:2-keto-4-pentenoate hydratase/2-oxohepta-3-ene-1,7-dioic acid hydratase in catechol pathway